MSRSNLSKEDAEESKIHRRQTYQLNEEQKTWLVQEIQKRRRAAKVDNMGKQEYRKFLSDNFRETEFHGCKKFPASLLLSDFYIRQAKKTLDMNSLKETADPSTSSNVESEDHVSPKKRRKLNESTKDQLIANLYWHNKSLAEKMVEIAIIQDTLAGRSSVDLEEANDTNPGELLNTGTVFSLWSLVNNNTITITSTYTNH